MIKKINRAINAIKEINRLTALTMYTTSLYLHHCSQSMSLSIRQFIQQIVCLSIGLAISK